MRHGNLSIFTVAAGLSGWEVVLGERDLLQFSRSGLQRSAEPDNLRRDVKPQVGLTYMAPRNDDSEVFQQSHAEKNACLGLLKET